MSVCTPQFAYQKTDIYMATHGIYLQSPCKYNSLLLLYSWVGNELNASPHKLATHTLLYRNAAVHHTRSFSLFLLASPAAGASSTLGRFSMEASASGLFWPFKFDPNNKPMEPRKAGKKTRPLKSPMACTNANIPNMYFTTKANGLSDIGRMPITVESELCKIAGAVMATALTMRS